MPLSVLYGFWYDLNIQGIARIMHVWVLHAAASAVLPDSLASKWDTL